jgi:hypothetical protein
MYKVRFAVEGHNKKVFANLVWNQACAGIISNFYRAMGNELKKDDPIDFEADDIIGQTVDAKLKVVTYEGTQKNEVAFYYEPKEETSATDKYIGEKPF